MNDQMMVQDGVEIPQSTVWDWELPVTTTSPHFNANANLANVFSNEFSAPENTALHSVSAIHRLSPTKGLKRKSNVERDKITKRPSTLPEGNTPVLSPGGQHISHSVLTTSVLGTQGAISDGSLPGKRIFNIQVGDKLFRLSGASISSDSPSYFTRYFEDQLSRNNSSDNTRTLYIDRDSGTFEDIAQHLRGYHVEPRDGRHFVKLFADAQYYNLPRLMTQLFSSPIHIRVGNKDFQIPRELFNKPGDFPNYFTLGFSTFFTGPSNSLAGSQTQIMSRPPAITPPSLSHRSALVFGDILRLLQGYDVEIRSKQHRADLLRDVRYFHLKGLEQRLIPHQITYNPARQKSEILLRLEDIRKEGLAILTDELVQQNMDASSAQIRLPSWVTYQRPYADNTSHILVFELGEIDSATLSIAPSVSSGSGRLGRLSLHGEALGWVSSLIKTLTNRLIPKDASLPVSDSMVTTPENNFKARTGPDAHVLVDGKRCTFDDDGDMDDDREQSYQTGLDLVLNRSQWRVRVQNQQGDIEITLEAVKIDAISNERARNEARPFLSQ